MRGKLTDSVIRRAAHGISRRDSVMTLGGAALAALASAAPAEGKGKKKRRRKRAQKQCRKQVGPCRTVVTDICSDQECRDQILPCCDPLATCNADKTLRCFFNEPEEA